jgi:integrase
LVDPAEIPSADDVARLGLALAGGRHGQRDELMANTAAHSGLRWGELTALTIAQVDPAARVITVDREVVEVAGHLYVEAPKNRKHRSTNYPRNAPVGYPLADQLASRTASRPLSAAEAACRARSAARPAGRHASYPVS